jgi:putative two-component system response regulator
MIKILIADDEPANRLILEDLLSEHYAVYAVDNGQRVLDCLSEAPLCDLILLDVVMPVMDGFEVCRRIKADVRLQEIPVLFISSLESAANEEYGLSLGADDYIQKPFVPSVVLARVRNHLELAQGRRRLHERNVELEHLVEERTHDLLREKQQVIAAQCATISAFCALAEARDNETGNHIRRTQNYVRALAKRLSEHPRFLADLDDETIDLLFKSAPLHDIGKVAIPDAILNKPGKLSADEWIIMRRHAEFGRDAIRQAEQDIGGPVSFLRYAREIAYGHHEKWDGSGYPQGLVGEAIPLSARLMAVADVYDALISKRCYKPAYTHERAIDLIVEGRGSHFDPDMVDALLAIADSFQDIARRYNDESLLGDKAQAHA